MEIIWRVLPAFGGVWGASWNQGRPESPPRDAKRRPETLAKVAAEGPRVAPGGPRETKKHPKTPFQKSEKARQEKNDENLENEDPLERNVVFSGLQSRKSVLK